jgi:hypothetical protein
MPVGTHLIAAVVLIVLSLAAVATVLGAGGAHPIPVHDLRVAPSIATVPEIPAARALGPVVAGFDETAGNPFRPGSSAHSELAGLRVPRPPAPPIAYPALPPLPLVAP